MILRDSWTWLGLTGALTAVLVLNACASRPPVPVTTGEISSQAVNAPIVGPQDIPPAPTDTVRKARAPESVLQTSVTLSFEQVSRDLGVPQSRLEAQTKTLANFLDSGKMPRGLCSDDENENTEKLCELLTAYRENRPTAASRSVRSSSGNRVPIRPHHFAKQQAMGYGRLMRSIHREPAPRILVWAPRMLQTTSCPRNLSAIAIRKIESMLPSPSARFMMEKLYDHASACLSPEDEGFESTHFRQALLRSSWGDRKGALKAIDRAVLAKDSDERARVLYWAGLFAASAKARSDHWNRLLEEYPLSFHALEVWQKRGVDPLEIFSKRPALALSRKVLGNSDIDQALRWLESLYIVGRVDSAQRLTRWIAGVYREELTPQNLLYVSLLKSSRGTPLNTITFLTRQVAENPAIINHQTLKILFPRPFFEMFDRNSPNTDTFLLLAVARQESGFNPMARSSADARGLLQLLPSTARILSGKRRVNLYDTEINTTLGAKFLSQLIKKFGSVELALAGYNAGPGRVDDWKGRFKTEDLNLFLDLIPFKETRNYVSAILRNNYWYERLYQDESLPLAQRAPRKLQRSDVVSRLVKAHRGTTEADDMMRAPASESL